MPSKKPLKRNLTYVRAHHVDGWLVQMRLPLTDQTIALGHIEAIRFSEFHISSYLAHCGGHAPQEFDRLKDAKVYFENRIAEALNTIWEVAVETRA